MAAKPYLEGKTWSFRLRIKGQEIYRKGFATAAKASKEAERLHQKILFAGKPKHNGPWRTTLGQALQDYARERLPFMKGAEQEACRINRYLRACSLNIVKVTPVSAEETRSNEAEKNAVVHFEVRFKRKGSTNPTLFSPPFRWLNPAHANSTAAAPRSLPPFWRRASHA